jgi:hypothetical protein
MQPLVVISVTDRILWTLSPYYQLMTTALPSVLVI